MANKRSLFISYSHADRDFVSRLVQELASRGTKVWLDLWEMKVGDSLSRKIQDGIAQAAWLAVVLSPDSVSSSWVQRELSAALVKELEEDSVFVLPILYRECEIPLFLKDKMYADFTTSFESGLDALAATVAPSIESRVLDALMSEDEYKIHLAGVKIEQSNRPAYLDLLLQRLYHKDQRQRRASMTALYVLDKTMLRPHLLSLVRDGSESVALRAIFYVGEMGVREGLQVLSERMSDGRPHVRLQAREAHQKITGPRG